MGVDLGQRHRNTVTYNPVGSGTGYQGILAGDSVDFGASDAPLSAYSSPACNTCVQIPWGLTATGVSFNINNGKVKPPPDRAGAGANIYLGQITNWDDSSIKHLNPAHNLPHLPISVFWRNDASGDSFAFTSYLSEVSTAANISSAGASTQPTSRWVRALTATAAWPAPCRRTTGRSPTWPSPIWPTTGCLPRAIKNPAGNFEAPNLGRSRRPRPVVNSVPSNNQLTIVNPPKSARNAYVISTFTYVMLPTNGGSRAGGVPGSADEEVHLLRAARWAEFAASLDFAHLPGIVLDGG